MAQTLKLDNYSSVNIKDTTTLADKAAAGNTTVTVANADEITAGVRLLFGSHTDSSEIVTVSSVAGAIATLSSALKLDHVSNTRISVLFGDKLRIYRAANTTGTAPVDTEFTLLATVDMDVDEQSTTYTDATGGDGYWYKYTYYNETAIAETSIADSTVVRGGGVGNYTTPDAIRARAGFMNNPNISDGTIYGYQVRAQDEVNSALSGRYIVPFEKPINATVKDITETLATGMLQYDMYRNTNPAAAAQAKEMMEEAREKLQRIVDGQLVLLNAQGVTTSLPSGVAVSGYPNNSTMTKRKFSMGMELQVQIQVTVTGGKSLQRAFTKLGADMLIFNNAMKSTGMYLTDYYSTTAFASQGGVFGKKWARLSPRYAKRKAKRYAGRPILIATGKMKKSFTYRHNSTSVEISNTAAYFKYHQSNEPREVLPRRVMMGFNAPIRREISGIFDRDIKRKIRKAGLK